MAHTTKIATCCYCGSRAALVLGKDRHELTCASCGAPLHDMKRLKAEGHDRDVRKPRPMPSRSYKQAKKTKYDDSYQRRRPKKKRKGFMRHLMEEAFDVIEDIFD